MVIVSHEQYKKADLPVEQRIIHPAIDPMTQKNRDLKDSEIKKFLDRFHIKTDKPIITQISRFDKWKDPEGVIDIFLSVKEKVDARLILCGSMASDDPEGMEIYERVKKKAAKYINTGDIMFITVENQMLVNVLQRISKVILQKSIREGFGLTVTEALWKGTPVVASNKGGIPLQIIDGKSGFLLDPKDHQSWVDRIIWILQNPEDAKQLGKEGREYVRQNFLMTRKLLDYLNLFEELMT
jgi:trehalose synthase